MDDNEARRFVERALADLRPEPPNYSELWNRSRKTRKIRLWLVSTTALLLIAIGVSGVVLYNEPFSSETLEPATSKSAFAGSSEPAPESSFALDCDGADAFSVSEPYSIRFEHESPERALQGFLEGLNVGVEEGRVERLSEPEPGVVLVGLRRDSRVVALAETTESPNGLWGISSEIEVCTDL